ncbi:MAG: thioredoxin [Bacteroidetes bacterium]|nr:thioredoxin [Bacteroidota bacterium]
MIKHVSTLLLILVSFAFISSCKGPNVQSNNHNVISLKADNFQAELSVKGIVLVDFWASWCKPCKMMSPVIDEIADDLEGKIRVGKVNIDEEGGLANQFNVQSIPNFIIFKDGVPVENLVGIQSKEDLVKLLGKYIEL